MADIDVKKLSPAAAKEIRELVGSDFVYLVAADVNNGTTFLIPEGVTPTDQVVSKSTPIKTQAVTSLNSAAFGGYQGSCIYFYWLGGQLYCFEYPC